MNIPRMFRHIAGSCILASVFSVPALAQSFAECNGTVYSTEEDFVSEAGEKYDGNPIVSDGDLISVNRTTGDTVVCARNAELIPRNFLEIPRALGLDAVDVILPEEGYIAFSTELSETFDLFSHGDIIFPVGIVIPHEVLITRFQLRGEHGLDGVHFVGEEGRIIEAIKLAGEFGVDELANNPNDYLNRLQALEVDIWFSIEGTTESPNAPSILDGDILSAVSGIKVLAQNQVLPTPIPAGIPDRGVDFGIDAVTGLRSVDRSEIRFSTEILYRAERDPFTDGDVLHVGGSVEVKHESLIAGLNPRADFLGLDALAFQPGEIPRAHIDSLCGRDFSAADFNTDGLWRDNFAASPPGDDPRRPCGRFIPIDGTLPPNLATDTGDMTRFRVTFQSLSNPLSGNIDTTWQLRVPVLSITGWTCQWSSTLTLATSSGWMDARNFYDALIGNPSGITGNGGSFGCANPHLHLAVWNTKALDDARENDLMRVRLEWETSGSTTTFASQNHFIQLDNVAPAGDLSPTPAPMTVEVRLMDGTTVVQNCGEAPTSESQFQIWAEFKDLHYGQYTLQVQGGDPWGVHSFASDTGNAAHEYFEPLDDPFGVIDDQGTTGSGLVHIRNIDMTELGARFTRCCYSLNLFVHDSAILHTAFNGRQPGGQTSHRTLAGASFEAGP